MTSVSSQWIPEDDLLLKNSIEAGASLEALAKGAVKFSRRFTFRDLRDRWYSLLYDPEVANQASARMAELEVSGTNSSSKSRLDTMKGGDKVPEKRKSIRRHYHAMRKRIKNEFFSSPNLGFFEERNLHNYNHREHKFQDHVTDNHEANGGDAVLDLGFEEKDFEILRQAFPESIGTVATTSKTNIVDNPATAFHIDGCHKPVENNFLKGTSREEGDLYKFTQDVSPSRNKIMGAFVPNNEIKNGTCIEETGPSTTPPIEKLSKADKSTGFGGKQHFHSPVSDGSASFHTLGFSSPSTRMPLWKTLEDVSAPDMPVDENNAESHQVSEETLALPEDCDHIMETKGSPGYDGPHQESHVESSRSGFNISGGVQEGEYTLPDSLLNFSNEDDILFMDADAKDPMHDISNPLLLDSPKNAQDVDFCSPNITIPSIQCREELKDSSVHSDQLYQEFDVPSTSVSHPDSLQLTEGEIICTLNKEDPDIPCNDDIFLLIHPSTQFTSSVGLQNATDSIDPLSSSHEKDSEQGLVTIRKGKEPASSFMRSHTIGSKALPEFVKSHPLVSCAFKRELPEGEYMASLPGKPNNIRIPSQIKPMRAALESRGNGMLEEDASKVELRGLGSPAMYNQVPLPPVTMIDPESVRNSYIDDHNNSDSDGDIPYFSDVEAMILEMDLVDAQESCITSEVARYQNESAKRMIMRLEQAARSSFQRAMSSHGALAIFYGRRLKHYIRKAEVTIGRSTDDIEVDIDLRKEGRANKISRRQAIIKLETDGSFSLKNLGASSISLNGKEVAHGQVVALVSSCLIEIRGMSFVFETNDKYVRRFLENQPI